MTGRVQKLCVLSPVMIPMPSSNAADQRTSGSADQQRTSSGPAADQQRTSEPADQRTSGPAASRPADQRTTADQGKGGSADQRTSGSADQRIRRTSGPADQRIRRAKRSGGRGESEDRYFSHQRCPDHCYQFYTFLPGYKVEVEGQVPGALDSSDFGFGANGVTVQPDGLHCRNLTDRAVLKQTLLTGKPQITRKEACDKMRASRATDHKRKAVPKEKWTAMMAAAASQHPNILQLDGETLRLKAVPDTSEGKVKYHNELMKACGLTLRELAATMFKASEKQSEGRRKRPRAG
eukprot:s1844_g12.t1